MTEDKKLLHCVILLKLKSENDTVKKDMSRLRDVSNPNIIETVNIELSLTKYLIALFKHLVNSIHHSCKVLSLMSLEPNATLDGVYHNNRPNRNPLWDSNINCTHT